MSNTDRHVQHILDIARDRLIADGWTRGALQNEKNERCTWGAVRVAAKEETDRVLPRVDVLGRQPWVDLLEHDAVQEVARRIEALGFNPGATVTQTITNWNDRHASLDDVLTLLSEKWETLRG